jgi:simple sugar transport system substrate-binding protein
MHGAKRFTLALASVALVASLPMAAAAQDDSDLTFYMVTHGQSADPYWVEVNDAAEQAASDLGVTLNVFHANGDIAAQTEAFVAAIAAEPDGIAVSSPQTGVFVDEVDAAKAAGIPVVFMDTDDPTTARDAYVGPDLHLMGQMWANYLVEQGIEEGDKVWMPVEQAGAAYGVIATEGVASVFDPLGVEMDVFEAGGEVSIAQANMTDFLTANADDVDAIIGLGDLVMTRIQPSFDAAGIEAGQIPVVGWGGTNETAHEVQDGYVNAAIWGYPDASGYDSVVMLHKAASGLSIGFDVLTQALYEADGAQQYIDLTAE